MGMHSRKIVRQHCHHWWKGDRSWQNYFLHCQVRPQILHLREDAVNSHAYPTILYRAVMNLTKAPKWSVIKEFVPNSNVGITIVTDVYTYNSTVNFSITHVSQHELKQHRNEPTFLLATDAVEHKICCILLTSAITTPLRTVKFLICQVESLESMVNF